jgi:hypothetical protein
MHQQLDVSRNRTRYSMFLGALLALLLAFVAAISTVTPAGAVAAPAVATAPTDLRELEGVVENPDGSLAIDPALIEQAHEEFRAGPVEPTITQVDGQTREVYTLDDGTSYSFTIDGVEDPDVMHPTLGGGIDGARGLYISFNYLDQQAILGGGGFALGAAICLVPVVGPGACIITGTILAAAGVYLAANGLCGPGVELRVYLQLLGYPECQ